MGRTKKLLLAGLVLAAGVALAWPFRKTGGDIGVDIGVDIEARDRAVVSTAAASAQREASSRSLAQPAGEKHVVAKMAGLARVAPPQMSEAPVTSPFDLAGHPVFRGTIPTEPPHVPPTFQPDLSVASLPEPNAQSTARPVYRSAKSGVTERRDEKTPLRQRTDLIHIVSNGDTLERLAKRYLRDPGRSLEIFDLNRDRLTNPHLLPIGVELRIPPHLSRDID